MKVSIALVLTAILGLTAASPQNRGGSKAQQRADRQALQDLAGTDVDPNLENGTRLLDNGQGQCVAVSGKASREQLKRDVQHDNILLHTI
ncbi:hypothetical protein CkaCkLH20_07746 [Colletotrichum karsti]|uniref:Uncharacterized protein n=1 Tax=Colletotrichum karsti TaxID=1095194 RepID=A0A9P6I1P5_9PEZI|nr:uncharacterized protein CkaCkLH20_07746 [Colletotrichum karsti]KAF9874609.1 hypothetical protein CkaCkLH20_07746 [Colletotrichum karsti]